MPPQGIKAFVGRYVAEEEDYLFTLTNSEALPCLGRGETCIGNGIIDAEGDDRNPRGFDAEPLDEFEFHLFRVHKEMIREAILNAQRKPIENTILGIPDPAFTL